MSNAFNYAMDIRKFEIELYWKRASYYWVFIGLLLTGYFLTYKSHSIKSQNIIFIGISCLGLIFTMAWYFVNRGSKYWQENWEKQVDFLEDAVIGPLYKNIINPEMKKYKLYKLLNGYSCSVTKINHMLSIVLILLWDVLFALPIYKSLEIQPDTYRLAASAVITVFTCLVIFFAFAGFSRSNRQKTEQKTFINRYRNNKEE